LYSTVNSKIYHETVHLFVFVIGVVLQDAQEVIIVILASLVMFYANTLQKGYYLGLQKLVGS